MPRLIHINNSLLFLCCSIYLGTGLSLVFFQLPLEPQLTIENYDMIFVKPVQHATNFFTYMTSVMLLTGIIMLATEWLSGMKWIPIIVLLSAIAATGVTLVWIFPLNQELTAGVTSNQRLADVFAHWAGLHRVRVSLWAIQWFAMMYYFYALARQARADR